MFRLGLQGHGGVLKLGMEGPEDVGGEGPPPPLEERRRQPEGRNLIFLPLNLGSSVGESESVKERVNEPIFESWWPEVFVSQL